MNSNEVINNLTMKVIDDLALKLSKVRMTDKEYADFVIDTAIDAHLRISYAVINGEKLETN